MTELEKLKSRIEDSIYENGEGQITGEVLQETLIDMVDTISENVADAGDYMTVEQAETNFNGISSAINQIDQALQGKANKSEFDAFVTQTGGNFSNVNDSMELLLPKSNIRVEGERLIISL